MCIIVFIACELYPVGIENADSRKRPAVGIFNYAHLPRKTIPLECLLIPCPLDQCADLRLARDAEFIKHVADVSLDGLG
jgi:hypothetical protein